MTEHSRTRVAIWPAAALGLYAAAIGVAPGTTAKLVLAGAAILAAVCVWVLLRPGRWLFALLLSALVLPPLPVALGNSGPHPALLFAALGLISGILLVRKWRIPTDAAGLALIALFLALAASVPLAALYSGPGIAAGSAVRVMLFGISLYVYGWVAASLPEPAGPMRAVRVLWLAGVVSATFACVDFYYQFPAPAGFGPQFVWLANGVFRRAQGVFYEASTLGNVCNFFLVMTAAAAVRLPHGLPVRRWWLAAGALPLAGALMLSYSRASVVALAVALGALAYVERGRIRLRRQIAPALAVAAAGAAVAWLLFPAFAGIYWARLLGSATYLFSATGAVFSGRLDSWSHLGGFLAEHPWHALLGIGYKTLPYSDFTGHPVVADNMYLSLFVETGVVGLAALLCLHAAALRGAWRAAHSPRQTERFFGIWLFCFWCGQVVQMFSVDLLTFWRVLPVYFWALAWTMRLRRENSLS